jgi:alpha-ketoglutarate-dependent taurine dioxygenase
MSIPTTPQKAKSGGAADPEIYVVKADQSSRYVSREMWHSDVTCDAEPPMGSMLYITKTPEVGGGDTCFISAIRAYETLLSKQPRSDIALDMVREVAH